LLEGTTEIVGVGSGDCAYMLLFERIVAGFVDTLSGIIILVR